MAPQVRFGLTLSNRGVLLGLTTPDELLEVAEMADAAHVFEHVWVGDQIMAKPRMESLTLMAALAARTRYFTRETPAVLGFLRVRAQRAPAG